MDTLLFISASMDALIHANSYIVGATTGKGIADGIRAFVGPILMMVMGIVAITFLFKREMTAFIIFLVISIVVAIIFYGPGLIVSIGQGVNKEVGGSGW